MVMTSLQIFDAPEIISEGGFNNSFLKLNQIRKIIECLTNKK
jgi:hypothetical protein